MALLDFTGFDHQDNNMYPTYMSTISWSMSIYGAGGVDYSNTTRYSIGRSLYLPNTSLLQGDMYPSNISEVIIGFAALGNPNQVYFHIGNSDSLTQACFELNMSTGVINVYRGSYTGTLLGTYTTSTGVWHYYEFKVGLSNTTGYFEVRVDGTTVINVANADTLNTGTTETISKIRLGLDGSCRYDDIYICDDSGSTCNDFLGDVVIDTILPSANGTTNDGTASAGSNYECVDEVPYDDDTSYVTLDAANEIELYAMGDLPSTAYTKTIYGVKAIDRTKKTDAGTLIYDSLVRVNGTNYQASDPKTASVSYEFNAHIWELNPDDSAAWEEADVNAIESGIKITTQG